MNHPVFCLEISRVLEFITTHLSPKGLAGGIDFWLPKKRTESQREDFYWQFDQNREFEIEFEFRWKGFIDRRAEMVAILVMASVRVNLDSIWLDWISGKIPSTGFAWEQIILGFWFQDFEVVLP